MNNELQKITPKMLYNMAIQLDLENKPLQFFITSDGVTYNFITDVVDGVAVARQKDAETSNAHIAIVINKKHGEEIGGILHGNITKDDKT